MPHGGSGGHGVRLAGGLRDSGGVPELVARTPASGAGPEQLGSDFPPQPGETGRRGGTGGPRIAASLPGGPGPGSGAI